jgi:hypothetical protein
MCFISQGRIILLLRCCVRYIARMSCIARAASDHVPMRPSPWKRRLVTAIRWSLLVDALVSASAALLTIVPWPVWTPAMGGAWPVGMVVPEIALWLVPLPVCFAAAALWLGRRSRFANDQSPPLAHRDHGRTVRGRGDAVL